MKISASESFPHLHPLSSQHLPPPRKRPCPFCRKERKTWVDYKEYPTLKKFTNYFGNIKKRYYTGVCLRHQKLLRQAVERARFMGILAYRK